MHPGADLPDLVGDLTTGAGTDVPPGAAATLAAAVERVLTASEPAADLLVPAGTWALTSPAQDSGDDWQDHLAWSTELDKVHRRVRLYPIPPQATSAERRSIELGAEWELRELHGTGHPGLVRAESLHHHPVGPAMVFRQDLQTQRFDHVLALHGAELDQRARVELVRQLAEVLAFAHGRHLYHGRLDLRAVLVTPRPHAHDTGWSRPRLEISNWHIAARRSGAGAACARLRATDLTALSVLARRLLVEDADALPDGPALRRLVDAAEGLRPADQPVTAEAFLKLLDRVEDETSPGWSAAAPAGLLEASRGDRVGDWHIERRVGTRPDGRLLLASSGAHRILLKVPLSKSDPGAPEREAQVLRRLDDVHIERLAEGGPALQCSEAVLSLRPAGRRTLARWLAEEGRPATADLFRLGDQLLHIVSVLEAADVRHGDVTPANLVASADGLTLVAFATGSIDERPRPGTPCYRDPFVGGPDRPVNDAAADRYSAAVVLHELSSGELPVWGDGFTNLARAPDG